MVCSAYNYIIYVVYMGTVSIEAFTKRSKLENVLETEAWTSVVLRATKAQLENKNKKLPVKKKFFLDIRRPQTVR